jgi:membrane protease YdiL (CAAX protease family)
MDFLQIACKGKTNWWRYLLTLLIVFVASQIGSFPLLLVALMAVGFDSFEFQKAAGDNFLNIGIDSNLYLFLMLFSFVAVLGALYLSVKYLHKLRFKDIITSKKDIAIPRVLFSFGLWAAISIFVIVIGIAVSPENYVWNFKPMPFFVLVLISLLFLPLQTSAEELLFRGYLMQGIGVLAKNRWFPLLVTSVLFGLLHGMNPEVQKLGNITMVYYIGTGLLLGIFTLMDAGTELALGFHAANNIVAALFVTTDWSVFQTQALFIDISEPSVGWQMFFPVLVLYPILIYVFAKKYQWTDWQNKLTGVFSVTNTSNTDGLD